jgi:hypothetical protein
MLIQMSFYQMTQTDRVHRLYVLLTIVLPVPKSCYSVSEYVGWMDGWMDGWMSSFPTPYHYNKLKKRERERKKLTGPNDSTKKTPGV